MTATVWGTPVDVAAGVVPRTWTHAAVAMQLEYSLPGTDVPNPEFYLVYVDKEIVRVESYEIVFQTDGGDPFIRLASQPTPGAEIYVVLIGYARLIPDNQTMASFLAQAQAARDEAITAADVATTAEGVVTTLAGQVAADAATVAADKILSAGYASSANTSATSAAASAATASTAATTATVAGKLFTSTAAGIAGTTNGQVFSVVITGNENFAQAYLNNAGVAVAQGTPYPNATAVINTRIGDKAFAGQRTELYSDLYRYTIERTNGTSPTGFAATYDSVNGGMNIVSTQSGRHVVVSCDYSTKDYIQSWKHTCTGIVINTSTLQVGLAFGPAGVTRKQYTWRSDGRLAIINDDETLDTQLIGAMAYRGFAAGNTISFEIQRYPDASGKLIITLPNGSTETYQLTNIPAGQVWFAWRGDGNIRVAQLYQESLNKITKAAIDYAGRQQISDAERNAIFASSQFLRTIRIPLPPGWGGRTPDFNFYRTSSGVFHDLDIQAKRPFAEGEADLTLYVSSTGNDSNGGTVTAPLRSLFAAAHGRTGKIQIYAEPGVYEGNNSFRNCNPTSLNLVIDPWPGMSGDVISRNNYTGLVWTLDTGTTYTAPLATAVGAVVNSTLFTADGDFTRETQASDLATCRATPGSWFWDGATNVYVNRVDGSAVTTANTFVYRAARNFLFGTNAGTVFGSYIVFEGGERPAQIAATNIAWANSGYFYRCKFKYSGGVSGKNGFNVDGNCYTVLMECVTACNELDGNNYHNFSTSPPPFSVELDCVSRNNGFTTSGTNNATTTHDGGTAIRKGGVYTGSQNRNVHDVNDAWSWNIQCVSRNSRSTDPNNSIDWATGASAGDATKMYLDSCESDPSTSQFNLQTTGSSSIIWVANSPTVTRTAPGSDVRSYAI